MNQPDFADAHDELLGSQWLPHLAAAAAVATWITSWVLLAITAPLYLEPYIGKAIALAPLPQLVLSAAVALRDVTGWAVLGFGLLVIGMFWRGAVRRGGKLTLLLFVLAGLFATLAVVVVLACASPTHFAQDLSQPR